MAREGITWAGAFEEKAEQDEDMSHVSIWGKTTPEKATSKLLWGRWGVPGKLKEE